MSITVTNLVKTFNHWKAVDHISLRVEAGDLVAILGPSGSGKSTLLRMIAGLETPDQGVIHLSGSDATGLSARHRNVGFVFQHYALFRHLTVWENVAFGLKVKKHPAAEIQRRVGELLELVHLHGLENRYPNQLSGGQRQRVAVARALAPSPEVLLLDEPFGALDAKVREDLRQWLLRIHAHSQVTTLFVTHDQVEALEVANKIIVMNQGRIEQEGTPREIFQRPASEFVARFVGESNCFQADVTPGNQALGGEVTGGQVTGGLINWGPFQFALPNPPPSGRARVFFRPNDVSVSAQPAPGHVPARIVKTRFKGPLQELVLEVAPGQQLISHLPQGIFQAEGLAEGGAAHVAIPAFHAFGV